jgi:hypothetical protein
VTKAKLKEQDSGDLLQGVAPKAEQSKPAKKAEVAEPKPKGTAVAKVEQSEAAPTSLLKIILQLAANPDFDADKLDKILAAQVQLEAREQAKAFNVALRLAEVAMPRIVKDKKTDKASYASLENVSKSIDSIAHANGLSMSFGTADSPLAGHYRVVCDLSHDEGHVRRYFCDLPADTSGSQGKSNKTPVQGIGSTMSYGRRYLKVLMFDLTIVGEDNDGAKRRVAAPTNQTALSGADDGELDGGVPTIDGAQVKTMLAEIEACGVTAAKFCKHYGITAVMLLPAHQFDEAIQSCKDYAAKNKVKKQ